jgi:hypothetical protein
VRLLSSAVGPSSNYVRRAASGSALAFFRSIVSKRSVNQLWTGARRLCASARY